MEVLGTIFAVHWGSGVSFSDRQDLESAWGRCLAHPGLTIGQESVGEGSLSVDDSLAFTALLSYKSNRAEAGASLLQSSTMAGLAENLTSEITLAAILEQAGSLTMLHACGIADPRTGSVVALVAKSGTGKTTASTYLGRAYSYVTDETVAIRPDGSVIPYPKPLSIKQASGSAKLQVGPDQMGLNPPPEQLRIGSIVLLDRVPASLVSTPTLSRVPLADAVLALIPETSSLSAMPDPLQSLCRLIESVGGVLKVTYSEAKDLQGALAPLWVAGKASSSNGHVWTAALGTDLEGAIPGGWLRRAAAVDAVNIDDELLVLFGAHVVRLTGIAPAIWDITSRAVSRHELVRQIGVRHGLPPGHEQAIDAAVAELVSRNLLDLGEDIAT